MRRIMMVIHVSEENEDDVQVIPDEADNAIIKTSKSAGEDTLLDNEGQEVTSEGGSNQTAKPEDKKPAQKHDNRPSAGS